MSRRAGLWWFITFALVSRGRSFRPVCLPQIARRGRDVVRCSSSSSSNSGNVRRSSRVPLRSGDDAASRTVGVDGAVADGSTVRGGHGGGQEEEKGPLVNYFATHGIESAEVVPAEQQGNGDTLAPGVDISARGKLVYVKTVIFQAKGNPFAAVMREDLVADPARMARNFRMPRRQVTLAGSAFVEELTGFPVGTIPPLGHRKRLPTLVDAELLKYSTLVGGAGCRGYLSLISVEDLVKTTGASVLSLARPRKALNDGASADTSAVVVVPSNTADIAAVTVATAATERLDAETGTGERGVGGGVAAREEHVCGGPRGGGGNSGGSRVSPVSGERLSGISSGPRDRDGDGASVRSSRGGSDDGGGGRGGSMGGAARVTAAAVAAAGMAGAAGGGEDEAQYKENSEASLDVVAAAMRAVTAALSAVSNTAVRGEEGSGGGASSSPSPSFGSDNDDGRWTASPEAEKVSKSAGYGRAGKATAAAAEPYRFGDTEGGASDGTRGRSGRVTRPGETRSASPASVSGADNGRPPVVDSATGYELAASVPAREQQKTRLDAVGVPVDRPSHGLANDNDSSPGEAGEKPTQPQQLHPSAGGEDRGAVSAEGTPGRADTVGAVEEDRPTVAAGGVGEAFGGKLARTAGTPTVDAIGGDVHLVAVVAGKRSLTRLLHFVDLVPPTDSLSASGQTCLVRKAWMGPGNTRGQPPRPVQVQLIMGKTMVDRLGEQDARMAMRGVKRGQLLYVTGRPTPDTRLRFSGDDKTATTTTTTTTSKVAAAVTNSQGTKLTAAPNTITPTSTNINNADTYDLVCCTVRILEDAPAVEPELVGKGDGWVAGTDYLEMDLHDTSVTYVDSPKGLKDMGKFLRETMLNVLDPATKAGAGKNAVAARPALAIDCEWRPGRRPGEPQNPVSLMQLAAGERAFIVDMLHVCRRRTTTDPFLQQQEQDDGKELSPRLTKLEMLLEDALAPVFGSAAVVKVGLGPKADLQSLMRSFPHMPCFRRVCGVVNLCDVAQNAASLRRTPAEEKGSLSRLSNLVLGKPLDKSEQCSDWGSRPLSGRQKRYAALDARATLLLHRNLAPEVPGERMKSLLSTFAYDPRAHGIVVTETLPSYAMGGGGAPMPRAGRKKNRTGAARTGGSRKERMDRKKMLGVTLIDVSEVLLDVEGLERHWLGRTMPDLTKEGVVRACIYPHRTLPVVGEAPTVLRFDRHQSFVEFGNGYALLMNCGGSARGREHASGFLNEEGSAAAWYLQGKLSSDATMVDREAAEWQQQQQQTRTRGGRATSSSSGSALAAADCVSGSSVGGSRLGNNGAAAAVAVAPGGGAHGSDAVGKFLERLADASGTPSSILGDLPDDDDSPSRPPGTVSSGEKAALPLGVSATAASAISSPFFMSGETQPQTPPPPHLVLFARSKGQPFVYCGAVDCAAQEYCRAESSRLGAVRLTLVSRDWRKAARVSALEGAGGGGAGMVGGAGDAFREVVQEGLRPPDFVRREAPPAAGPRVVG